jgi:peptide/nickel transport system permease protein
VDLLPFIARRLAGLVVTLIVISFLVFSAIHVMPGDPASVVLEGSNPSPEAVAAIERQYNLDRPFFVQYGLWVSGVVTGDFGDSIAFGQGVGGLIWSHASTTALLVAYTMVLIVVFGTLIGLVSALRAGLVDRSLLVATSVFTATPAYVAAIVFISLFAVSLGWFPTFGNGEGFLDRLHHLTLPAIALALTHVGLEARVTRSSVLDALSQEHVEVARARGVPERQVLRRHVLHNAWPPILTVTAMGVGTMIAGTTVVEKAFGLSGLGSLLVEGVTSNDVPLVQALTLIIVAVFVLAILMVDVAQRLIDPRVDAARRRPR